MRTVEHIRRLIRQGAKDFRVRQAAIGILRQRRVKPKDYAGEVKALFEWVQQNVRYTKDTFRLEVLHSARRMLELRAGDCDDFSIVLGAMLEAIGHPVRLVITGPDRRRPDLFSHIYIEVFCDGRWIALDATMPHAMGWAPRTLVKQVIAIDRRPTMMGDDMDRRIGAYAAVPDSLRGLVRAIRREAIPAKDPRMKSLWDLLRSAGCWRAVRGSEACCCGAGRACRLASARARPAGSSRACVRSESCRRARAITRPGRPGSGALRVCAARADAPHACRDDSTFADEARSRGSPTAGGARVPPLMSRGSRNVGHARVSAGAFAAASACTRHSTNSNPHACASSATTE